MNSFEEVRAHVRSVRELKNDDPYLITLELKLSDGRRQGIYLAELEAEGGRLLACQINLFRAQTPLEETA